MKNNRFLCTIATLVLLGSGAGYTHAAVTTFTFGSAQNYGSDLIGATVSVDNNTAGYLTFNVSVASSVTLPNTGDLLGVFLEFNPHPILNPALSGGSFSGAQITGVSLNTLNAGGGNNLNGTIAGLVPGGTFDAGLTIGHSGSSGGLITSTAFTLQAGSINLSDIVGIGLRFQAVGTGANGGNGSSKLYSTTSSTSGTPRVPDGGTTLALLGASLLGLGSARRLMRKQS